VAITEMAECHALAVEDPTKAGEDAATAVPAAAPSERQVAEPAISVIVCSYNSRHRIAVALDSLAAQDTDEPYEVIVVDSGTDDAPRFIAETYPDVRVVRSERRLFPGPARNLGVRAAGGRYLAFVPDDGVVRPDWLRKRLAKHRDGFAAVGGAITNATPHHPVGSAGYYLEYSALIPSGKILSEQQIPHCLSYDRELFERFDEFPESTETGEDTMFNERLAEAGVQVGYDPDIQLGHRNLRRLVPYLRHQYEHGRGLMQCVREFGLESPMGPAEQALPKALYGMFARYPVLRWWHALQRIARGKPQWVPEYLLLTPITFAGLWATSAGALAERRRGK
jgi:hypothetical protein